MSGFGPRKFRLDGAGGDDSDCTPGETFNKKALDLREDTDDLSEFYLSDAAVRPIMAWTTEPGIPGLEDWPNHADYNVALNVKTWPSGAFGQLRVRQIGPSCSVVGTSTSGAFTAAGIWTYSYSADPPASSGARFQVILDLYYPSGGLSEVKVRPNAASYLEGPFTPVVEGAYPAPQRRGSARLKRM